MAGFLYFHPGTATPTKARLEEIGFPHWQYAALPGCQCYKGPADTGGYVFTLGSPPHFEGSEPVVGYYPEKQKWREILGGMLWLGVEKDNPPGPVDVQHKTADGSPVELADGQSWIVPAIRDYRSRMPRLPTTFDVDTAGNVVMSTVVPKFAALWNLTQQVFGAVESLDFSRINPEDVFRLVCDVLAMNYRVSVWELGALGIITTENHERLLAAVFDISDAVLGDGGQ